MLLLLVGHDSLLFSLIHLARWPIMFLERFLGTQLLCNSSGFDVVAGFVGISFGGGVGFAVPGVGVPCG